MKATPQINSIPIPYRGKTFQIEYFHRTGNKETVLFIHGLGGAKENYWEACKADILKDHTLICFDNPGTGNSTYFDDLLLNIDDLVEITSLFIDALEINNFILVGTSMGGLTTLLYLQRGGSSKAKAYINIEGNLMPEDCMFSSQVVSHDYESFHNIVYPRTIVDMKKKGNTGYHIIANNLQLNTNILSYYNYSFQTVSYSASGDLLRQYINLDMPRLFIYGSENRNLSYLPELQEKGMATKEISDSNHFVFYDNPKEMYDVIGEFIHALERTLTTNSTP
ncbi:alpha/beta fold hydrolase [Chryseolinea lacunae]|uniref:Alpha/beta hydrolase n=1 Tax=Chryseolinea lacunae TaxID=2801331 RepID=A0ABS1KRV5_9BACT|nr:alpha/beta hydrolase [Chryseolinea lacunae]MBL0741412.1 alpha/beta hydrolase [Chryseolinea lacunae]